MTDRPSVAEFERNCSAYIDRVASGERLILTRGGEPVVELRPVRKGRPLYELGQLLASLPRLTDEEADAYLADIEKARDESSGPPFRDPWAS
ncbi:MAG TPA: hypothetical protein VHG91_14285 [Longimicrobium sp.]|nr:hypothetical protein [Longimicrobium sp.]